MYTKLKKSELIDICKCFNLNTTGTKKILMKRINENVNTEIQNNYFESTSRSNNIQTNNIDTNLQDNIIEKQNKEFEQSLINDKLKTIKQKIKDNLLNNLSISELKLYLDSININYNNILEKKELLDLLKQNCSEILNIQNNIQDNIQDNIQNNQSQPQNIQKNIQEDIHLNIDELRKARLNYFNNLK